MFLSRVAFGPTYSTEQVPFTGKGTIMNEEQLKALASFTAPSTQKESKTIDYKVSMENKAGVVKAVGIFKIWKRFSDAQQAQIVKKLTAEGIMIELLTDETAVSDDEF